MTNKSTLKQVYKLRQELHKNPELSGEEEKTRRRVLSFLKGFGFTDFIHLNGGSLLVFLGDKKLPKVIIRSELDALPIEEDSKLEYKSKIKGKAHLCGHDGHMSSIIYTATLFKENMPKDYCPCLLFQSAEETGQGAKLVMTDKSFGSLNVVSFISYHNLPSYKRGLVLSHGPVFAAGSCGVKIKLRGYEGHAAHPEKSLSPIPELIKLIEYCEKNNEIGGPWLNPTHINVGEPRFGITPGNALLHVTLRSTNPRELDKLKRGIESKAKALSKKKGLKLDLEFVEDFPVLVNDKKLTKMFPKLLNKLEVEHEVLPEPVRWSEDFAVYAKKAPIYMFCIGSGEDQPALHHPTYDFPDEIIPVAGKVFKAFADECAKLI